MISFGKIGKLTDGIVDKVLENILADGSDLVDQLVQKVHKSGLVDEIIETVIRSQPFDRDSQDSFNLV